MTRQWLLDMVNISLEEDEEGGGNHSVGSGGAGWEEDQPLWEFWVPGQTG